MPGLDQCAGLDGGACLLPPAPGVITGSVIYSGDAHVCDVALAAGRTCDAVLLLFSTAHLPPPDGDGTSATALARVPAQALFGASRTAPFSAPFTFTQVPPGTYQIRAFLDAAGEFNPFFDFTLLPRAGDPLGGHVDLSSGTPVLAPVTVQSGQITADANVVLGAAAPFDPPAFQLAPKAEQPNALAVVNQIPADLDRPLLLRLSSLDPGVPHAKLGAARFALELHRDANGLPQDTEGDGLLDVWPQVILRQLTSASGAPVAVASAAIVPCKVVPIPVLPLLLAARPGDAPIGVDHVDVVVDPFAVQLTATGGQQFLPAIPQGSYQLIVIEKNGQVWTLPNSLGGPAAGSASVPSQATAVEFVAPTGGPASISGTITYAGSVKPGNLIVQAFHADTPFEAPPIGAAQPARMQLIPGSAVAAVATASGFSIPYKISGLAPGSYVVLAVDAAAGTFGPLNLLATATKGDVVGAHTASGRIATVAVTGATTGIDVTLVNHPGQDAPGNGVALDPPAFELDTSAAPAQIAQDARAPVRLTVHAKALAFPAGAGDPLVTTFTVGLVPNAAQPGAPADYDGDGLPDVWPRAFLVQLDPADPAGLREATPTVAIPAAVDPTPFLPRLLASGAPPFVTAQTLSIIVRPAAVSLADPAHPARLPGMPDGKYKLVLVNATGQVWQVPNEAGSLALDPRAVCGLSGCAAGQVATSSQSQVFTVVKAQPAAGEIRGTLSVSGLAAFKRAYVFAYSTASPPPLGLPVSADVHEAAEFAGSGPGPFTVAYALRGLPPGSSYVVTALVDVSGDFALAPLVFAAAPAEGSVPGSAGAPIAVADATPVQAAVVAAVTAQTPALPPRPSFVLLDGAGQPVTADVPGPASVGGAPLRLHLHAQRVLTSDVWPTQEADPASFPIAWAQCVGGAPVDLDGDHLPDVTLQARLVLLGPDGVSPQLSSGQLTVLPAVVDPTPLLGALRCSGTTATPLRVSDVFVAVTPAAARATPAGQLVALLPQIPAGRYQLILVSPSHQVWRLPNELAVAAPTAPQLAAQGVAVAIATAPAPTGAIVGSLRLSGAYTASTVGPVLLSAWSVTDPPPGIAQATCGAPACGTGRPAASLLLPLAAVDALIGAPSAGQPYALPVAPGAYFVTALMDPLGEFNPALSIMSSAPLGAQELVLSAAGGPLAIQVGAGGSTPAVNDVLFTSGDVASEVPVERPIFEVLGGGIATLPPGASTPLPLTLSPPSPLPALPYTPGPVAFHPFPVHSGTPLVHQGLNPAAPYLVSTQVVFTPLDASTGPCAPIAVVDMVGNSGLCNSLYGSATAGCSTGGAIAATPFSVALSQITVDVLPNACVQGGAVLAQRPSKGSWRITLVEGLTSQAWSIPNEAATALGAGQGGFLLVQ